MRLPRLRPTLVRWRSRRVCAVIVTFGPDRTRFEEQARRVRDQVDHSVIVDNGSPAPTLQWLRALANASPTTMLIALNQNLGIAAAQNRGIEVARTLASERILLLDHDSLPSARMVQHLSDALDRLEATGLKVAAVGPRYLDARQNNPPPFIRVANGRLHRLPCSEPETINEVDYLIASGSLIPMSALDQVGPMNEALFIDYVDIEWGLRARTQGYLSYGICAATMAHDLGGVPIVVLGHALPNHSAQRHYYHFRNAIWLLRYAPVPRAWKVVDGYRLVLRFGFYALFARPRLAQIGAMLQGVWHGARGRLGPRPGPRSTLPSASADNERA